MESQRRMFAVGTAQGRFVTLQAADGRHWTLTPTEALALAGELVDAADEVEPVGAVRRPIEYDMTADVEKLLGGLL